MNVNKFGDLTDEQGNVLVPAEKRVKCEVYSRVVGYCRPVSQWNKGKKAEWHDRALFVAPLAPPHGGIVQGG